MNDDAVKFLFDKLIEYDKGWYDYTVKQAHDYVHFQQLEHNFVLPHGMSILEVAMINYYKSQNSWRVNSNLRSLTSKTGSEYQFDCRYVDLLNACLDKTPKYSNSTVWRLESYTNDVHDNILDWYTKHKGEHIKFLQFLSCSKDIDNVDRPNSTIFEIESSDITRLHDIGDLVKVYRNDGKEDWEAETIFKTGSVFKIGGVLSNKIKLVEVTEADIAPSEVITIANENYWE